MKYINIENGTWLVYDTSLKRVVDTLSVEGVDKELSDITERLGSIPPEPTAEEFEAWGRANMPRINYAVELDTLTTRKSFLEEVKRNIS